MVRYSVSMMLIWSRPNRAAGTRCTNEIATNRARADVTRVHSPIVNSARMTSDRTSANRSQPGGTNHQNE